MASDFDLLVIGAGTGGYVAAIRAAQLGLNANEVATNINVSLSSSEAVTPNFWTDPKSGIPYYFAVQTPEHMVGSLNDLGNTPVSTAVNNVRNNGPELIEPVPAP